MWWIPPGHSVLGRSEVRGGAYLPAPGQPMMIVPLVGVDGEMIGFLQPMFGTGQGASEVAYAERPSARPAARPSAGSEGADSIDALLASALGEPSSGGPPRYTAASFGTQEELTAPPSPRRALLLETLAELTVIGLGIFRMRTLEQASAAVADARHRHLETLLESLLAAGIRIRGSLALDDVLSEIAVAMTTAGGFGRAAIYLLEEDGELRVRATVGLSDAEDAHLREESVTLDDLAPLMQPEMRISRSFFFDHRYFEIPPELDAKLETPSPSRRWVEGQWHAEDSLTVPLTDEDGTLLGVISVDEPVNGLLPDRDHVQALEYFADQSAVAVNQARRYATMRAQASTDDLTGLANRRAFTEASQRAVAHAQLEGGESAILYLDLDEFKRINDTLGHAAGDAVLQRVGAVLADRLRRGDLLARYGGEEFVMLLPDTTKAAATELAEELRLRVAAVADEPLCGGLRVTASIGVAALSTDVSSAEALIIAADAALYEAKRTGRDRVCVFGP